MKKIIALLILAVLIGLVIFCNYWFSTQPVWIINKTVDTKIRNDIPSKNKQIVDFIEANGKEIAPSYDEVVCTEFVIEIIEEFNELTEDEKNSIQIITTEDLDDLIKNESPIIKGVQTALIKAHKGTEVFNGKDVKPGDFVQFWNVYQNKAYGHCGIILDIQPNKSFTVYSSHPLTDGYGKQKYLWPDKAYFVRLN